MISNKVLAVFWMHASLPFLICYLFYSEMQNGRIMVSWGHQHQWDEEEGEYMAWSQLF